MFHRILSFLFAEISFIDVFYLYHDICENDF